LDKLSLVNFLIDLRLANNKTLMHSREVNVSNLLDYNILARGKLIKGPLFNSRPAGVYKQKIAELMA